MIERLEPDADVLAGHGCSNERVVNGEQRMETRERLSMRQSLLSLSLFAIRYLAVGVSQ